VSIGLSKAVKPKRQVVEATSSITAKNVLVKFDPNADNSEEEEPCGVGGRKLQVSKPPAQVPPTKPPAMANRKQPASGVENQEASATPRGDFNDFDDSDSDDDTEESKARRLQRKAESQQQRDKEIVIAKEMQQQSHKAPKKVQSVPEGVAVIPIKTFSMGL
jgi:hypothetical protein